MMTLTWPLESPAAALETGAAPIAAARPRRDPRHGRRQGQRQIVVLIALALVWEGYGRWLNDDLLFPTLTDTVGALIRDILSGELPMRVRSSLGVLALGYGAGAAGAAVLVGIATLSAYGRALLEALTAMFNPLPAIALLPLALLWFGIGTGSLVFVIAHSVLWPLALSAHAGFLGVSPSQRMAGENLGLRGVRRAVLIYAPAAFPSILSGLRIGWAFAWRTLIAAELVFGVSSRSGGLGWFIYEHRNALETPDVFAGLLCVVLIGLAVELLVFGTVEKRTVKRWGMQ